MDEIREEETEYERVMRLGEQQKYKRDFGPGYPASNQPGSDKLALFWIVFAVVTIAVYIYFGTHGG
jgi:hypothetical protein